MNDFEAAFAELRAEFLRGSRTRLQEIGQEIERLAETPSDRGALAELLRHFHGLAGSGGTYGFPNVTTLGRRGEEICGARLDAETPLKSEDVASFRELSDRIRAELAGAGD